MTRAAPYHTIVSGQWSMAALRAFRAIRFMSSTRPHALAHFNLEVGRKSCLRMTSALRFLVCMLTLLCSVSPARADNLAEYQVKADFLVNFVAFTEWPADMGNTLNLCVYGPDPFGAELDKFRGRSIGKRSLLVTRINSVDQMDSCQIVFITRPVIDNLLRVLDNLSGKPVLTIADSIGAMRQGVVLNMGTRQGRVTIEANLAAARRNGLNLSSKMLNLASEVKQ